MGESVLPDTSAELTFPQPRAFSVAVLCSALWRRYGALILLLLAIALVWEGGKALFAITDYKLPHISKILAAFIEPTNTGELWWRRMVDNASLTFGEAVAGFVMGSLAGFLFAAIFAHSRLLERGLLPYVVASQTVPILAVAPLVVVWLGTSWFSKSVIAAYLTFFPVTINALRGFRSVEQDSLDLMYSYAASRSQIFWKLRVPAALPFIFTALKISATASIVGAIIGELPVGSPAGIGVVLINANQYYNSNPPRLWAAILVSALLGLIFYTVVVLVERFSLTWQVEGRGS